MARKPPSSVRTGAGGCDPARRRAVWLLNSSCRARLPCALLGPCGRPRPSRTSDGAVRVSALAREDPMSMRWPDGLLEELAMQLAAHPRFEALVQARVEQ